MRLLSDLGPEDKKKIRETPWDIVVYHDQCPDGVTAAWIVLRGLDWRPSYYGSEPSVVPYQIWQEMNERTGLNILVVDLSFPKEASDELYGRCNEFLIIDHHQTAARNLSDCDYFIYGGSENTLSGAGMVKEIYELDEDKFRFVDYVSDRDTWQNLLPDTKAINLAMSVKGVFGSPKTVEMFYSIYVLSDPKMCLATLAKEGSVYLKYQEKLIHDLLYSMKVVNFDYTLKTEEGKEEKIHFPIAILNASIIQSDTANYILRHQSEIRKLREEDFPEFNFAIVYTFGDPTIDDNCGFRVRCENPCSIHREKDEPTTIGADDIAALFDGGGHARAAGFYCSAHEFFERTTELSDTHPKPLVVESTSSSIAHDCIKSKWFLFSSFLCILYLMYTLFIDWVL